MSLSRNLLFLVVSGMLSASIVSATALAAPTTYTFVGESESDNADVQRACELLETDHAKAVTALHDVLAKHPRHRIATFLLGRAQLREGKCDLARQQIDWLVEAEPPSTFAIVLGLEIADAQRDPKYAKSVCERYVEVQTKVAFPANPSELLIRRASIARMLGDLKSAEEQLLRASKDAQLEQSSWFCGYSLGEFYLRTNQPQKAILAFAAAEPKQSEAAMVHWRRHFKLQRAKAIWAAKVGPDALDLSIECLDEALLVAPTPESIADAACQAFILSKLHGKRHQQRAVDELVEKALARSHNKLLFSQQATLLALVDADAAKAHAERVVQVLKGAPHSEWAGWAALYLLLTYPDLSPKLLKLLPAGSVQRELARQEGVR